jgi:hypothetical protein
MASQLFSNHQTGPQIANLCFASQSVGSKVFRHTSCRDFFLLLFNREKSHRKVDVPAELFFLGGGLSGNKPTGGDFLKKYVFTYLYEPTQTH